MTIPNAIPPKALLDEHLQWLNAHWIESLQRHGFDSAWIAAGTADFYFQDDHGPKFKPNPFFSQWVDPQFASPGAALFIGAGHSPILFIEQPSDYWHAPAPLPTVLEPHIEIRTFPNHDELQRACSEHAARQARSAYIGPVSPGINETLGTPNPTELTHYLQFHRAKKTAYELAVMREATRIGVHGHAAATQVFHDGGTEYDIHMAYLQASRQSEVDLPYGNIVALNEHASILHYQHQDREHAAPAKSLLIDAGGSYRGYASDITRTHVRDGKAHDAFRDLLAAMEQHQLALIAVIAPGLPYLTLHERMHQQLADILVAAGLITCTAEQALQAHITEAFCPHGLGHLLGLQVHDSGGHLANAQGDQAPPPSNYPSLRFTRAVEEDYVFTIEPGLYFIPSLLNKLRADKAPINWTEVDALSTYGGIRIEDNVRVLANSVENLTRDAFAQLQA